MKTGIRSLSPLALGQQLLIAVLKGDSWHRRVF